MTVPEARRRGLSLLEVLLALAVLALGALAVLGIFPIMARQTAQATVETQMLLYCQDKLDEVVRKNVRISSEYASEALSSTPSATRRWRGLPDELGDPAVQTVEVETSWVQDGRARRQVLYGIVTP